MIQLRVYLGAALYQPENVLILRDVLIESVTACDFNPVIQVTAGTYATYAALFAAFAKLQAVAAPTYTEAIFAADMTLLQVAEQAGTASNRKSAHVRAQKMLAKIAPGFDLGNYDAAAMAGSEADTCDLIAVKLNRALGATTTANAYAKDRKAEPGNSEFSAFGVMDHPTRYTSLNGAPHMFNMSKASFDN